MSERADLKPASLISPPSHRRRGLRRSRRRNVARPMNDRRKSNPIVRLHIKSARPIDATRTTSLAVMDSDIKEAAAVSPVDY